MNSESSNRALRSVHVFATLAGAAAVVAGSLVLAGWALDLVWLKSILPSWVSMKPNAAVAFVLTGMAQLSYGSHAAARGTDRSRPGSRLSEFRSRMGWLAGLLAGLIGLLTLIEYIAEWDFGFDQWLFPEPAGTPGTTNPGRMAPDSALGFTLLSATAWISRGWRKTSGKFIVAAILGMLVTTLALAAIVSYLALVLYPPGSEVMSRMALPTAILFAGLGAATAAGSWQNALGPKFSRFSGSVLISTGLVVLLTVVSAFYVRSENQVSRAGLQRYESYQLADELRQSGDDLTRMVRTFVATGDPVYQRHFQDILDIRDGKKPRPENYSRPYWDLVLANGPAPRGDGPAIPLLELMRQAKFTETEFRQLEMAKANSDALTIPEFEAMQLIAGTGPISAENRAKAVRMLNDEKYHQAKFSVMQPIHDFYVLMDRRTREAVQAAETSATLFRHLFMALGLGLVFMLWRTHASLGDALGGEVDDVSAHIAKIGRGDFSSTIKVKAGREDTVLGWLAETQAKLSDAERERQRAEAALRRSEARFRSAFNLAPLPLCHVTKDGVIDFRNERFTQVFGYTPEEVTTVSEWWVHAYPDPAYRRWVIETWDHAVHQAAGAHQDIKAIEYQVTCKHGEVRLVEIKGIILGEGVLVTFFDITERKKAEEALAFQAALLRETGRIAQVGGWEFDPATGKGFWTEEVARIHDLDPADRTSMTLGLSFYVGPSRARIEAAVKEAIESGTPYDLELELTTAKQQRKWVRTIGHPIVENGKVVKVHGSFQDITERKRAEREIHQLNADLERRVAERTAELSDLYNNAPCGYHSLDADGRFVRVNDTELKWLGYTREEVAGKMTASDLLTPASLEIFERNFPVFRALGGLENLELEMVRKDGSIMPVLLSATAVTDQSGRYLMSRSTMIDYTERKRAEIALGESRTQLEAANKELEAFSYSVSHDLRAPLRGIDGWSHALVEDYGDKLDERGREFLARVCSEAQRMGRLIDELLQLARLNRVELRREPVDLSELATGIVASLRLHEPQRPVQTVITPGLQGRGDPVLLRLVMQNLFENAWKFSSKSASARIEFGGVGRPHDGALNSGAAARSASSAPFETPVFFIRDNGAGFDMAHAAKLFAPFQRLHRQSEFPGTGIGLATVQRILRRHGGRIWAEAEPDHGATFHFTLSASPSHHD